jgi:hypothetical protein
MALLNNKNTKDKWLEQIFTEYPEFKTDTLKLHYIENMIEAYLADEKNFKKMTYELKKKGDDVDITQKTLEPIVSITKIEAEAPIETAMIEEVEEKEEVEA